MKRPRGATSAAPPATSAADAWSYVILHVVLIPALLVAAAVAVQSGPLDLTLARLFYDTGAGAFTWRHSLMLDVLGHQAARGLPVMVASVSIALAALGQLRPDLVRLRGVLLAASIAMLLVPLVIGAMKWQTSQHCPSDIAEFGGVVGYAADQAMPFWSATRQAAGHCLPSAHAGGGYALLSLYFAGWAAGRPAWRWGGLALGLGMGLAFSLVRMMQGAHFASATLWSAAVAWTVCAVVFLPVLVRRRRATSPASTRAAWASAAGSVADRPAAPRVRVPGSG